MIDPAYPDATDWPLKDYLDTGFWGATLTDWEREESRKLMPRNERTDGSTER